MKQKFYTIFGLCLTLVLAACSTDSSTPPEITTQGTFVCQRTINGTRRDNIIVPANATCRLTNTVVDGNILVESGARLIARGVRVDGNVQATGHRKIVITRSTQRVSTIDGNVLIEQGGDASVIRARIDGNLLLERNQGRFNLSNNRVDDSLRVNRNTGTGLRISRNVIDDALRCSGNQPAPTGSGNSADRKVGQCSSL